MYVSAESTQKLLRSVRPHYYHYSSLIRAIRIWDFSIITKYSTYNRLYTVWLQKSLLCMEQIQITCSFIGYPWTMWGGGQGAPPHLRSETRVDSPDENAKNCPMMKHVHRRAVPTLEGFKYFQNTAHMVYGCFLGTWFIEIVENTYK